MLHRKAFVVTCFQKFAGPFVLLQQLTLAWGAQTVTWQGHGSKCYPRPPCIGVAKIFDWGGPNQKSHAMMSSGIFEEGTFCRTNIL